MNSQTKAAHLNLKTKETFRINGKNNADDDDQSDDDTLVVTKAVPIQPYPTSSPNYGQPSRILVGEIESLAKRTEALHLNGDNLPGKPNKEKYVPEKNIRKDFRKLGVVLRNEEEEDDEDSEKFGYKSANPNESEDEDLEYVRHAGADDDDDDDDGLVVSKARPISNAELDNGFTSAARVIIEGDTNGLSETFILQQLRNKLLELDSISSRRAFFCPSVMVKIDSAEYPVTALEYAAFKDKGGIVQFLVNTITDNCFEHVVEAVKYLDQRDRENHSLVHGMVASSFRMSNSLRVLIEARRRLGNSQEFLLFNPTVGAERTVLDVVRENDSLAPFVREIVERELELMLNGGTAWLGDEMAVEMVWQDLSDEEQQGRGMSQHTETTVPYNQLVQLVNQEPVNLAAPPTNLHNHESDSHSPYHGLQDEQADLVIDEESLSDSVVTLPKI